MKAARNPPAPTADKPKRRYDRILLKLSGEALMGEGKYGISQKTLAAISQDVKDVVELGVQVALTIGGGNIFRGVSGATEGMDLSSADYIGMLATVINAMALQDALERIGIQTRIQSAIEMHQVAEPYIRRRAMRHLEKGRVVIFAAGTGNPYMTTTPPPRSAPSRSAPTCCSSPRTASKASTRRRRPPSRPRPRRSIRRRRWWSRF